MTVPLYGSDEYNKIVALGCGAYKTWTDYGYEYDCKHGYDWPCDHCPCVIDKRLNGVVIPLPIGGA